MTTDQLAALRELRLVLSSTLTPNTDQLWDGIPGHSEAVNSQVIDVLRANIDLVVQRGQHSAQILPIVGPKGSGKTHTLSWGRQYVQESGGVFVAFEPSRGRGFWPTLCLRIVDALGRPHAHAPSQRLFLLDKLTAAADLPAESRELLMNGKNLTPLDTNQFTQALLQKYEHLSADARRAAIALTLANTRDPDTEDIGLAYLSATADSDAEFRKEWRLGAAEPDPQRVAIGVSQLIATVAGMLVSVDQVDELVQQADHGTSQQQSAGIAPRGDLLTDLGEGLMDLRQGLRRAALVLACQPLAWERFDIWASGTAKDRFHPKVTFKDLPSAEAARDLAAERLRIAFEQIDFQAPYPTWPIKPEAFEETPGQFRPRILLQRIRDHVEECLNSEAVAELGTFEATGRPITPPQPIEPDALASLDARYKELLGTATVDHVFNRTGEDSAVPDLLFTAFTCALIETGAEHDWQVVKNEHFRPGSSDYLGWHVRLVREIDETSETVEKLTVRTVTSSHWKSIQSRARKLAGDAELTFQNGPRNAVLLRPQKWSRTPTFVATERTFRRNGGRILTADLLKELRIFAALQDMRKEGDRDFDAWLRARKPASATAVVRAVLVPKQSGRAKSGDEGPAPPSHQTPLLLGLDAESSAPIAIGVSALAKHTAVFAGSGSGKTAKLRRLIEQCALRGISVIVLDPNNDLARLADPWPEPPPSWHDGDAAMAERFLEATEVVVWTPGRQTGRPLSFRPLPDFTALADDPDEFRLAVDSAVAVMAPRAKVAGSTSKDEQCRAVLRAALRVFVDRTPTGDIKDYLRLLNDFPADASAIAKAPALAHDMAQTLEAVRENDPLFGGDGEPLDPAALLTPSPGKRARISVVNFIGLPEEQDRQGFVNQLQMALFSWVKRNPAGDRPLQGLYVMDEAQTFAPSGRSTPCTHSTVALASQARKYGLGLVFATQSPRGIHPNLVGNCATQFYGFLNTVAHIEAVRELARARSGAVPDIALLKAGQFYVASEGVPFRKTAVPMCLSFHPGTALAEEEVLRRARG
ncbi:ATP-binding protein [Glycomyces niveus]|uniref:ATP-binding protein n=1 Tax=Glycomyces niveus TaxID=2820287 RepID=A0ABS3U9L5_9ACTN|nr:ATP-binding protein [Glycomyces sp. NEAU-S30]MBO3735475.1 ATP-binding protein [Glycomyces sp. NEAU-S30]